jgi:hypothetical protein
VKEPGHSQSEVTPLESHSKCKAGPEFEFIPPGCRTLSPFCAPEHLGILSNLNVSHFVLENTSVRWRGMWQNVFLEWGKERLVPEDPSFHYCGLRSGDDGSHTAPRALQTKGEFVIMAFWNLFLSLFSSQSLFVRLLRLSWCRD